MLILTYLTLHQLYYKDLIRFLYKIYCHFQLWIKLNPNINCIKNYIDKIQEVMVDIFQGKIKEVFLYDSETSVGAGFREAGSRKGFKLSNSSRTLVIKCFRVTFYF